MSQNFTLETWYFLNVKYVTLLKTFRPRKLHEYKTIYLEKQLSRDIKFY